MKITLTQEPYIDGREGSFLRTVTENGKPTAEGIWGAYYTAAAEDSAGNTYRVFWRIKEDYDAGSMEEDCACDWNEPFMVLDAAGLNVTGAVELEG